VPFPRIIPPASWIARAASVVAVLGGIAVLISRLPGVGPLADALAGSALPHPVMGLAFALCGASLWLCASPAPPPPAARMLAAIVTLGGLAALAARLFELITGLEVRLFPDGPAAGALHRGDPALATAAAFALTGLGLWFLDRESRQGRRSLQFPVIPVLWMAYLGLIAGFYDVPPERTYFIHVMLTPWTALLFAFTGAGILLARPRHGLMAVISNASLGGILARFLLPLIAILPFTVGWLRLRALRTGSYELASGFAMFTASNTIVFGIFVWIMARTLNRLDLRRRQAFESLRTANLELQRVNEALENRINEHNQTEEARKKTELQLFQSQKMEAMGTLASGIAHDFNNILTVILLNAETARETAPADPLLQKCLQEIKKSGTRAADLIRQIMTFGRKTPGEREAVQPADSVKEAVEMLRVSLPSSIQIQTDIEVGVPRILADPTQLQQVLLNLGTNASHAMAAKGGVLDIQVKRLAVTADRARLSADLREGDYVLITVSDTGHGMSEETLKKVFDPFFTTKPPGKGTGLGLSVAHGIVRLHGGCITVYSEPGRGTVFNIYLPVAAGEDIAPARAARIEPPRGNGEHLLCVDDNLALLETIGLRLERLGYTVTTHEDPLLALEDFRARPGDIDLVLTDFAMPEMSGRALALELLRLRPDLPVILMSGFMGPGDARAAAESGIHHVLLKPDVLEELDEVVHRLLHEAAARR
jgi:signal transduction histidine kinase/ActR/RegA family two-component response regulator